MRNCRVCAREPHLNYLVKSAIGENDACCAGEMADPVPVLDEYANRCKDRVSV